MLHTMLATTLAEDRRRALVADAVALRSGRAARRFARRARSAAQAPDVVPNRHDLRLTWRLWVAGGQL
jgi:hypothetical protein